MLSREEGSGELNQNIPITVKVYLFNHVHGSITKFMVVVKYEVPTATVCHDRLAPSRGRVKMDMVKT